MSDDSDKKLMELLEHDIADTAELLDQGYEAFAICAAKMKNCLMIYRTTLKQDEYKNLLELVMESAFDVPNLNEYKHLLSKKDIGLH